MKILIQFKISKFEYDENIDIGPENSHNTLKTSTESRVISDKRFWFARTSSELNVQWIQALYTENFIFFQM